MHRRDIEVIFKTYYRPLCLYALHYMQDADAAEDVVQDCFVRLVERMETDEQPQQLRAYLYAAVRNKCIDQLRRENPLQAHLSPQDLEGDISDEEAAERSVDEARLWTAVDTLPSRCREILLMSKRDNKKYREIAEELGISEKTVEHQISKALKILRGKAQDFMRLIGLAA